MPNYVNNGGRSTYTAAPFWQRTQDINLGQVERLQQFYHHLLKLGENYNGDPVYQALVVNMEEIMFQVANATGDEARRAALQDFSSAVQQLADYFQGQQDFERSTPAFNYAQLVSIGISPSAAKQIISGTSPTTDVGPVGSAGVPDTFGVEDLLPTGIQTVSTVASTAMSIFQLFAASKKLKYDLSLADAIAQINKVNANIANKKLQGLDAANSFSAAARFVETLPDFDKSKVHGNRDYLQYIMSAAESGNPECSSFVNDYLNSGAWDTYDAQYFSNFIMNGKSDNEFYRDQLVAQLRIQDLSGDKLCSEISNIDEGTNKIIAEYGLTFMQQTTEFLKQGLLQGQIDQQNMSNEMLQVDHDILIANKDTISAIKMHELSFELCKASTLDSDDYKKWWKEHVLNDMETMKIFSYVGKCAATQGLQFWNDHPEMSRILSFMAFPQTKEALSSFVMLGNATGQTNNTGGNVKFGPLEVGVSGTGSTENAMFLHKLFYENGLSMSSVGRDIQRGQP